MSVTEPVDVLLTDREKVPDIRARSLSERRDNIYPVGWLFNPRGLFFFWGGVYNDVHYVIQALLTQDLPTIMFNPLCGLIPL